MANNNRLSGESAPSSGPKTGTDPPHSPRPARAWRVFSPCLLAAMLGFAVGHAKAEQISAHVSFDRAAVNRVVIRQGDARLAVYAGEGESGEGNTGDYEMLVLPHGRRDLVWGAEAAASAGAKVLAPLRERYWLEKPHDFWTTFTTTRFHDYGQQSTKIRSRPLAVDRWVKDGETITWRGVEFRVLETPAYTRGSVCYLTQIDDLKLAFTGDLIYGDGQIIDLYSFQDAIPEAQIRGYHGYGSRLAGLVAGLSKIAAEQPDVIIPARGPIIRNPQSAIAKLTQRVRALYRNYLSTNALHWYFKEPRMRLCAERILGADGELELMPYSHHEKTPDWVFEHSTSRLLIADSGRAFLLDCGYQRVIDAVKDLMAKKIVSQIDGIFVTHYHDDHTDMVQAAAEEFSCPVYATSEYADVLQRPHAYHLPAMTANPIKNVKVMQNGQTMKWEDLDLTFHFFPGQTFYHGALLAEKKGRKPIFFIGDAFAPSGLDDYCVLNRNLVHEDGGYLLCLKKLRAVKQDFWLVNEHIPFVFSFSEQELKHLEDRYRARIEILRELFPWDAPNYGIDEQWAVFHPYGTEAAPAQRCEIQLSITNHSPKTRSFTVRPHPPQGAELLTGEETLTLAAGQVGRVAVSLRAPRQPGNYLLTSDVLSEGMDFRHWVEALITVER